MDAASVIGIRTTSAMMGGDPLGQEARLMVREKLAAALEVQTALASGSLGPNPAVAASKIVRSYGRKVRANQRRLRAPR
jgi:hypothetical protein